MTTALANERKSVSRVVGAFFRGAKASEGHRASYKSGPRYFTDGTVIEQWGNVVARKVEGGIFITDAGYQTVTTKQLLNAILDLAQSGWSIEQYKYQWWLYDQRTRKKKPWQGSATIRFSKETSGGAVYERTSVDANRKKRSAGRNTREQTGRFWYVWDWVLDRPRVGPFRSQAAATRALLKVPRRKVKMVGSPELDRFTVAYHRGSPVWPESGKNPLTRKEAARALWSARRQLAYARSSTDKSERSYHAGMSGGLTTAVHLFGPRGARRAMTKVALREGKLLPNDLKGSMSVLKNLHTARERAYAKKLIERYWQIGKAALVAGKMERAAHAYGALAAIRRIARFERPHAQTVANLASFGMDLLRRNAKDLAKYRGSK